MKARGIPKEKEAEKSKKLKNTKTVKNESIKYSREISKWMKQTVLFKNVVNVIFLRE